MAHFFQVQPEALLRRFSVYVVVARRAGETRLYVGKTGDNREGCNPIISRCGNHFSYNKIHSQVRNKFPLHEKWQYTYVFDHFDEYCDDLAVRRRRIDRINEMERWLNTQIQKELRDYGHAKLENPFRNRGVLSQREQDIRTAFRNDPEATAKLSSIVDKVRQLLGDTTRNCNQDVVEENGKFLSADN